MLSELAEGSAEFVAAAEALRRGDGESPTLAARAADRVLRRLWTDTIDTVVTTKDVVRCPPLTEAARQATQNARLGPRLSVLLPAYESLGDLVETMTELEGQSMRAALEWVVAATPATESLLPAALAAFGSAVRIVVVPTGATWPERLNACVAAASGEFVTCAMPFDRWQVDAFAYLVDELLRHPSADAAVAGEGLAAAPLLRFDRNACVAVTVPPLDVVGSLGDRQSMGLHAVWRRRLHQLHGCFDPAAGAGAEYAFWLRLAPTLQVRRLPTVLTIGWLRAPWRSLRQPSTDGPRRSCPGAAKRRCRPVCSRLASWPRPRARRTWDCCHRPWRSSSRTWSGALVRRCCTATSRWPRAYCVARPKRRRSCCRAGCRWLPCSRRPDSPAPTRCWSARRP
jgi:hypothetical protein